MAVYGSIRHQKNIIWTEASEVHIIFFWWRKKTNRENKNVKCNITYYIVLISDEEAMMHFTEISKILGVTFYQVIY